MEFNDIPGAGGFGEEKNVELFVIQPFEVGRFIGNFGVILPGIFIFWGLVAFFAGGKFHAFGKGEHKVKKHFAVISGDFQKGFFTFDRFCKSNCNGLG